MNLSLMNDLEVAEFHRQGFVVRRGLLSKESCAAMLDVSIYHHSRHLAPVEYEVDVRYPGAPLSRDAAGAGTSRRLLHAFSRDDLYRRWAVSETLGAELKRLFSGDSIAMSQCHHNCIMTKEPGFSSATLWHQDNRYWSFDQENLISVWLALGEERPENGCLRVIPGSHLLAPESGRFDSALFLRPDLPENKKLIVRSKVVTLSQGDVLFFHSRLFHAAGRNLTDRTKYSVVFTYHEQSNHAIQGTRSARFPSIELS